MIVCCSKHSLFSVSSLYFVNVLSVLSVFPCYETNILNSVRFVGYKLVNPAIFIYSWSSCHASFSNLTFLCFSQKRFCLFLLLIAFWFCALNFGMWNIWLYHFTKICSYRPCLMQSYQVRQWVRYIWLTWQEVKELMPHRLLASDLRRAPTLIDLWLLWASSSQL